MSNKKKIIIAVIVVVVLVIFVMANLRQSGGATTSVQAEEARSGRIIEMVGGNGKIQPKLAVKISANVSAKIIRLHVEEGDVVEKDRLLVELDRTRYEASVVQAQANLSSAHASARRNNANLDKSKIELERFQRLFNQGLASQGELDVYKASYEVDKANYEAALDQVTQSQAFLDQAEDDLSKTILHAPIAGVVTQLNKEEGEIALGSQFQEDVIMVVSDLSHMEAVTEIDENDVVNVSLGDSAIIHVDAFPDTQFVGQVSEIAHTARTTGLGTQAEVTNFDVKIAVLDRIEAVRPGMSATVDVVTQVKSDVIRVPIQAVTVRQLKEIKGWLEGGGGSATDSTEAANGDDVTEEGELREVMFVVEDGTAKARMVNTGISSDTHIEIVSGIAAGDMVVTGSYRVLSRDLQHDAKVKIEKSRSFQSQPN